ncbi:branched-chain amino acid ABC transporter permease [Rhizobium sp. 16-449-1b]|uniref:branched-chain amino acid ABC transporter permease n=1 Tax=Rhizobium sp. 16-449-1b TaxID=2819989 RepID=UPI001AD9DFD9|nr:branched-chain amino acid ABC transporter permease [Rhizobium sp. 16-449-1b]MBO9195988.1 branched-chain amino acid ABC transporter permease [Rhizobium sp. 16-449-1b]
MATLSIVPFLNVLYEVSTLAVLVLGLAVIFGLLGVLNLAHGEFIMMGAYSAYLVETAGLPFVTAIPLTMLICGVLGFAVERWLIRPLYKRPFDTLIATWGLGLLLRKVAEAVFGLGYKSVTVPLPGTISIAGDSYPTYRLVLIAASVAILISLVVWFTRSYVGMRIRAMESNPDLADAVGIPVRRLASQTFIVGTCLAGLGGVAIAPLVSVQPYMGLDYVLRAFFALVIGGLGSVVGVLLGSTVIGGLDSTVSALTDGTFGYFSVLVVSVLFLWLKPRGIYASA